MAYFFNLKKKIVLSFQTALMFTQCLLRGFADPSPPISCMRHKIHSSWDTRGQELVFNFGAKPIKAIVSQALGEIYQALSQVYALCNLCLSVLMTIMQESKLCLLNMQVKLNQIIPKLVAFCVVQRQRNHLQCRRQRFDLWVRKIPWRRKRQPAPVVLPGESRGQRSLVGYNPWGHKRVRHDLATKP